MALWDNPIGTDGFEFVEYTAPDVAELSALFERMGFRAVARHRSKNVTLFRQGEVNFVVNAEPDSHGSRFAREHGPSACAMALRTRPRPTPSSSNAAPRRSSTKSARWSLTFPPSKASAAA